METYTLLKLRLTPRGGRDALTRYADGILYLRVAAAPVDGAANKAVIELLSDTLDIAKSRIVFQSGEASRVKLVRLHNLDFDTLVVRITAALERGN